MSFSLPLPLFPVPPSIEASPGTVASLVGSRVSLQCDSSGIPKPEVRWEKDGVGISDRNYVINHSGSLFFAAVKMEDGGDYRCTASNEAGSVSRNVTLSVQGETLTLDSGVHRHAVYSFFVCIHCYSLTNCVHIVLMVIDFDFDSCTGNRRRFSSVSQGVDRESSGDAMQCVWDPSSKDYLAKGNQSVARCSR